MSNHKEIEIIIVKYFTGAASEQELGSLEAWLADENNTKEYHRFVKTNFLIDSCMQDFQTEKEKEKLLYIIQRNKRLNQRKQVFSFIKYAAIMVGIIFIGALFFQKDFKDMGKSDVEFNEENVTVLPGTNKAILTLSDGTAKVLGSDTRFKNDFVELHGTELVYTQAQKDSVLRVSDVVYNAISVPRGGQFELSLSDGSKVWLNSESKLRYPVNFIPGSTRKVELLYGEAYFDISSSSDNQGDDFWVQTGGQSIQVLGTEFNVKAYKDESFIYSTLIEGSVSLITGETATNLVPNEQAVYNKETTDVVIAKVDTQPVVSWKDGIFSFKGKSLKDLMKVIARWYDVDVVIDPKIESLTFKGQLRKNQNLEEILFTIKNASIINSYKMTKGTIYIN